MSMRYQWLIIPSLLALTVAGSMSLIPKHVYIVPDFPDFAVREGDDLILRCKARVLDATDVQLYWTHGSRKRMRQSVTKIIEENKEDSSWTYQTELPIRNFTAQKQGLYRCKLFIGWSYSTHRKIRIFLSSGPHWRNRNRGVRVDAVKERKRENSSVTSSVYFVAIAPGIAVVMVIVGIAVFIIYRKQSQRSTSSWSAFDRSEQDSSDRLYAEPDEAKACPANGRVDPVRLHQYYNIHQGRPILYF